MPESVIALIILAAAVLLFIWDRLPIAVIALLVPLALWATGVLDLGEAVAGFGDPTVLFIAALFVVSEALDASGVTAAAGGFAMRLGGTNPSRLMVTVMLMAALLTALITPNGSVAALTPVIVVIAIRAHRSPSELLMPAAFAAHSGSLLMLIGSPVTVVVADYAESTGAGRLGLFSTGLVGVVLTAATIGVVLLVGSRLVPQRSSGKVLRDLGAHGALLAEHYGLDEPEQELMQRGRGTAEFIIPPRSRFIGDLVHHGMVTESGELVVAGMHHKGRDVAGPLTLSAGDSLLFRGSWQALANAADDPDIIAVDDPDAVRRQAVRHHCSTRSTDQQHGNRPDRHSDRCVGHCSDGHFGDADSGGDRGLCSGRVADTGGHPGESDGAGGGGATASMTIGSSGHHCCCSTVWWASSSSRCCGRSSGRQ